jgi:carbonic anhydrase/acetyltransferase-like protein (isoleucine patch superfamily)
MPESLLPENFLSGTPSYGLDVFVGAGARILGDVRLAAGVSLWYNCVLRADLNVISVGENTNIQDGAIVHVETDRPCAIADHVTVGHGAIVHACTVESGCLIGMGAIILSGAFIGRGSVIAAGSLVRENARVEPFSLMAGVPARLVRKLPEETLARHLAVAVKYAEAGRRHRRLALRPDLSAI